MKKIKVEHLDTIVSVPRTTRPIQARFIDENDYDYFYSNGFDFLFETEEKPKKVKEFKAPMDFKFSENGNSND